MGGAAGAVGPSGSVAGGGVGTPTPSSDRGDVTVLAALLAALTTGPAMDAIIDVACAATLVRLPMLSAIRCWGDGAGSGSVLANPSFSSTTFRTPSTSRLPRDTKTSMNVGALSLR